MLSEKAKELLRENSDAVKEICLAFNSTEPYFLFDTKITSDKWAEFVQKNTEQPTLDDMIKPLIELRELVDKTMEEVKENYSLSNFALTHPEIKPDFKWGEKNEKERGWRITSYKNSHGKIVEELHEPNYTIYSVLRLSDNVEFKVGDETDKGNITALYFTQQSPHEIRIQLSRKDETKNVVFDTYLSSIQHKRTPIFTTSDNVDVFEGDRYWVVGKTKFEISSFYGDAKSSFPLESMILFSTEAAAKEYVLKNKPLFSFKDVVNASERGRNTIQWTLCKLEELAEQKLSK